nr:MAG TPA_asm: DNA binding protein [Caudoviricetes sp.]
MKDIIFKILWGVIALLFVEKLGQIAKEIHFLGVETRRVAFAINTGTALTMEQTRLAFLAQLKEAGFTDKEIEDYFKKQN